MDLLINDVEARVLGSLMEKALATPEYYPLSLNALMNACNQKSSRDPVVSYDEPTVQAAAGRLEKAGLVGIVRLGRVTKYEELLSRRHNMLPGEAAVLCVLLLRGPQTLAEIRSRSARMHAFDDDQQLSATLVNLQDWDLVKRMDRLAGHKENRYTHLLCGSVEPAAQEREKGAVAAAAPTIAERVAALETAVDGLRSQMEALQQALDTFKEQFE